MFVLKVSINVCFLKGFNRTLWVRYILFCSFTPTNLGQFLKQGTDLKTAGPDIFKTPLHVQFDQVLAEIFEVKD